MGAPVYVNEYKDAFGHIVVVRGPRHGFEADNAAAAHTGLAVECFRRAVRSSRNDGYDMVWKYVL